MPKQTALPKVWKIVHSFALIFVMLVILQFNTFCMSVFYCEIFGMFVTLVFIPFIALIFNMYINLNVSYEYLYNFLIHICIIFWILFLGL